MRLAHRYGTAAALLLGLLSSASMAADDRVPVAYRRVAATQGIPPALFYAVALTESGRALGGGGGLRPWPWTLNVSGQGLYFPSRRASWEALRRVLARGERSVDIGLMQVSWRYHAPRLGSPWRALDPEHNLQIAARLLRECSRQRGAWWAAIGCYHAPNDPERAARYRRRVERHWRRIGSRG